MSDTPKNSGGIARILMLRSLSALTLGKVAMPDERNGEQKGWDPYPSVVVWHSTTFQGQKSGEPDEWLCP